MSYTITQYSKTQAAKLGVLIKPSTVMGKKIDVFNSKGEKLASIGAIGYSDYPTYLKNKGKEFADKRRKAYKKRHESDRHVKGSAGYFTDKILWVFIIFIINFM
jgi:hypothetical protein